MGEIAGIDLEELRGLADRVAAAADDVSQLRRPALQDGLPGSAVATVAAELPVDDRIGQVVTQLHDWARAARKSADALERADRAHAGRLPAT